MASATVKTHKHSPDAVAQLRCCQQWKMYCTAQAASANMQALTSTMHGHESDAHAAFFSKQPEQCQSSSYDCKSATALCRVTSDVGHAYMDGITKGTKMIRLESTGKQGRCTSLAGVAEESRCLHTSSRLAMRTSLCATCISIHPIFTRQHEHVMYIVLEASLTWYSCHAHHTSVS